MNGHERLIRRLDDLGATAVRGTTAPPLDTHALRRGRRHGHRGRWLAGIAAATAALIGAALWAPWAGDAERVDTVASSPTDDVMWAPSTEGVAAPLRQVLPADEWQDDHGASWYGTRAPSSLAVSEVDGHVVAAYVIAARNTPADLGDVDPRAPDAAGRATVPQAAYAGGWELPQPGQRIGIDLGGGHVLVVGSATLPFDQLVEVASHVAVDGDEITVPGQRIGAIDADTMDSAMVTVWETSQDVDIIGPLMPIWIVTLEHQNQLDALRALGDRDPSRATWDPVEPVHSIPGAVMDPARTFDVHGVTAELMTLNGYARMVVIPSDPPAVVIANDGVRYADIDDTTLAAVAASLRRVPRSDLATVIDNLPVRPTTTTTFDGNTTATTR